MVRPWKAGNYPEIGKWSVFVLFGWRFVVGIIMRWDRREPFLSNVIKTLGNNKASSLLLLGFAKVSSTKDLLYRQTCQEILLCLLHPVTSNIIIKFPFRQCAGHYSFIMKKLMQFFEYHQSHQVYIKLVHPCASCNNCCCKAWFKRR